MNGKNLIRRIGGFVLAALILFSVGIMSSTAVEARGRGGFHGGFHGRGFHAGPRFGFGFGYPYGYPAYPYPYGYYGHPYGYFGFRR